MSIKKAKFWETALQIVIAHAHGQFQFAFDITGQIHEFGCFSKVDNWTTHATCVMSLWKPSYSIDGNVVQIHSSQLHNQAILSKLPPPLWQQTHFLGSGAVKLIWYDLSWSGGEADGRVLFSQGSRGRRRFLSGDQLFTRVAFWFLRFTLSLATSLRSSRHLSPLFVSWQKKTPFTEQDPYKIRWCWHKNLLLIQLWKNLILI